MNQTITFQGVRHGEVLLRPVDTIPTGGKVAPQGDYILAHSETGHHHVLEGTDFKVTEFDDGRVFLEVLRATKLVHQKTHDKHETIVLPPSMLERYHMVEYNPASDAISVVRD